MNKQEVLDEIAALKEQLNNMEKLYDSLYAPSKRWRAKMFGNYYYIDAEGKKIYCDTEDNLDSDDLRYGVGNYFRTKEEAKFEIERLKVIAELKEFATPISEFDWNDIEQKKCMLSLDDYGVEIDTYYNRQSSDLVFESEEVARNAIEAVGEERIVKCYFRRGEINADNN